MTASPMSWMRHMRSTLSMSTSGSASRSSRASMASRQECSATDSCRPEEVQEWRVLHLSFSSLARKARNSLGSILTSPFPA